MNFITADTATPESVDDAVEAAFDAVMPGNYIPPVRHSIPNLIAGELDEFLTANNVSRIEFFNGTHRMSALRAKFVAPLFSRGFTAREISSGSGIGRRVVDGIKYRARK